MIWSARDLRNDHAWWRAVRPRSLARIAIADIAVCANVIHSLDMKHCPTITLAILIVPTLATATPTRHPKIDVCRIAASPKNWIGKAVRVEGYVVDLSSHGFVLTGGRGCMRHGQLGIVTNLIDGAPIWRNAFAGSSGPKRAILIGRVHWTRAQMGGRNPSLEVLRIESIAAHEARWDELS